MAISNDLLSLVETTFKDKAKVSNHNRFTRENNYNIWL